MKRRKASRGLGPLQGGNTMLGAPGLDEMRAAFNADNNGANPYEPDRMANTRPNCSRPISLERRVVVRENWRKCPAKLTMYGESR
jgi:hypothetical protein